MAGYTMNDFFCISFTLLCCFFAVLATGENSSNDQIKELEFDVMPGGQVHVQEDTWNGVTCKFTYACQGGTKEKWEFGITASSDIRQVYCSVKRPSKTSYLYFLNFKLEINGATVVDGEAYGNDDKSLGSDEYKVDEANSLLTSKEGGFKNELSRVIVHATAGRGEL